MGGRAIHAHQNAFSNPHVQTHTSNPHVQPTRSQMRDAFCLLAHGERHPDARRYRRLLADTRGTHARRRHACPCAGLELAGSEARISWFPGPGVEPGSGAWNSQVPGPGSPKSGAWISFSRFRAPDPGGGRIRCGSGARVGVCGHDGGGGGLGGGGGGGGGCCIHAFHADSHANPCRTCSARGTNSELVVGAPARAVVAAAGAAWQRWCRRCNRCRRCISIMFAAYVVLVCCAGKD